MEEYGIELKLVLDKFNQKMEEIKNKFKGIENVQVDAGKQFKIDNLTKRMQIAQQQLDQLQQKYKKLAQEEETYYQQQLKYASMTSGGGIPVEQLLEGDTTYQKMIEQLDRLKLQIESAKIKTSEFGEKIRQLKQPAEEVNEETKKIPTNFSKMGKGIEKATSKIKRFGLALFSIRSIYSLISRASSAYLAQDTELSNKITAAWTALGSMLAPIIEAIATGFIKLVKYINVFIKALTGVDLVAKAMNKTLKNSNKNAKALSKTLAGFDELTNLDTTSDSKADTGWIDAFNSVEIDTTWADRIKEFGEWVKNNGSTVILWLIGIGTAIVVIKSGLDGITKLGIITIIAGVIIAVQGLIKYLNDPSWKNFGTIIAGIGIAIIGLGILFGGFEIIVAGVIVAIVGIIVANWDKITTFIENGFEKLETLIDNLPAPVRFVLNTILGTIKGIVYAIINQLDGIFTGWKKILDGMIMIFKGDFKGGIIQVGKGIANVFIGIINGITSGINVILSPIRALIVEAGKILGKGWTMSSVSIPKIPLLNVGTNYVPEDQMAMIHKGEAIIPKKFNSSEYFGGGNEETNSLLSELIEAVNSIDINPYTTIKDVGNTAVNYINNRNRQLGRSVIA